MFKKVLIANRGEIAVRVIRACRELGIQTVAVYSEVDRNALHVRYGDEAYLLGPAPSRESYLRVDKILSIAKKAGADAIHPGYGFLAEREDFAQACADEGIVFIGPKSSAIAALGDKGVARAPARREAEAAFGDGSVYLEKLITRARHIEIQLLADEFGNVVHLGERECSLQR